MELLKSILIEEVMHAYSKNNNNNNNTDKFRV